MAFYEFLPNVVSAAVTFASLFPKSFKEYVCCWYCLVGAHLLNSLVKSKSSQMLSTVNFPPTATGSTSWLVKDLIIYKERLFLCLLYIFVRRLQSYFFRLLCYIHTGNTGLSNLIWWKVCLNANICTLKNVASAFKTHIHTSLRKSVC